MAITFQVFAQGAPSGAAEDSILALSWQARGALNNRDFAKAEEYAAETRKQALAQLKHRALDAEPKLPTALGASIEVTAQALAATGKRGEAVAFLQQEIKTWGSSSIVARLQKNLNMLTLEGKPAPALDMTHSAGQRPVPLASLHGHVVLLFFWAHWCGDCKVEASVLQQLNAVYGPKGLALIGPTQHYGYAAEGQDASRDVETEWIDAVRQKYYARVGPMAVPVSEENFRVYGASTMPTLVLVDKAGIVRLYHPGGMSYDELAPRIEKLLHTAAR
jgi:thiol-disulfide isomerase/thioredoxin